MIAVVLAAGRGTRLGNRYEVPKPLVPVAGVPVIDRILRALGDEGFADVVVVTGHRAGEVERHVAAVTPDVNFNRQPKPAGTADALQAARQTMGEESFLLTWGDVIVPPGTFRRTADAAAGLDGALAINHLNDLSAGGEVTVKEGRVIKLVEKPGRRAGWNLTGVLALTSGIWDHIAALHRSVRGEFELPEAIDDWIGAGATIAASPVDGAVFDVGHPSGLEEANAYLSDDTRSA